MKNLMTINSTTLMISTEITQKTQILKIDLRRNRKIWVSPFSVKEFEVIIRNPSTKKALDSYGFIGEFYQTFKEEITPILHELLHKIEGEEILPISFYVANIMLIPKPNKGITGKEKYDQYPS